MNKKILVTGAAGLIGSQVVKELISRKYEVIAVDNFSYGHNENDNSLVTWLKEDITKSIPDEINIFGLSYSIKM